MPRPLLIAVATAISLASLAAEGATTTADVERAVAEAGIAADVAHEQLSDRYRVLWSSLSTAEKSRFAATERAWLNGGREEEEVACRASSRVQPEALAVQLCRLAVTERRLAELDSPQAAMRLTHAPAPH